MEREGLSPKVTAVYQAVTELFKEGADLNGLTVSEITARAGIGKGTVYEYFSSKEEILAGALHYESRQVCDSLYQSLKKKNNLYEKLELIMMSMENHMQEVGCAFKLFHLLMDNSQISKQLREIYEMKKEMPIFDLIRQLIEDELGEAGRISGEDLSYLVIGVISRIMGYAMYLKIEIFDQMPDNLDMRMRLCRDICREVDDFR